jgi:hypothetical protein
MPITNVKLWEECVAANQEPYGKCCVDIARACMEILDKGEPFTASKLISEGELAIGESGITGFMAGCIAQMISECHSRGDEFRKDWNAPYVKEGQPDNGGTVNPAIVTIEL